MPVELKGADNLRKALRKFEPDLAKKTTKEMAAALKPITNKARGFMPANASMLSGWTSASSSAETTNYREFPKYDQTEAKRGVKYSTAPSRPNKRGFVSLARIINSSAGGAIYETAGRKNASGQPSQASTRGTFSDYIDTSNKVNKSLNPNAGKQFINRANSLGALINARPRQQGQAGRATRKMTGRVIFRAFAEDQGRVTAAIVKAIGSSAIEFKARTDGK
tara:strand:+ start:310 stop:975 length:666 start_codon:yes stop_codon:yes gene_type:complete